MVARSESMFGCYDSYSYRLWSLANVWNTCQFPSLANGIKIEGEDVNGSTDYFIKCPQCQKGYQTFQGLKEHMESAHPDLAVVENGSASIPSTVSPSPTLTGSGGPFGCSQCTASFTSKDQLEKHELLHSPNAQASCKICNKVFANVYRLQRHKISHEESAVLRKFKCTECDKAFKFKHHLKEHIRIHSGEKPFECINCGKRFSHSGSYSSHMTSKKCLVMNLKLGRTRMPTNNSLLEKNANLNARGPKRTSSNPLNNNITTSPNHNAYLPILPKYTEAAAAFLQSSLANPAMHSFYLTPPAMLNPSGHAISPYSVPNLGHLLEQLQSASPHRAPIVDTHELNLDDLKSKEDTNSQSIKEHEQAAELNKSNSSSCSDLIMDEDTDVPNNESNKHATRNATEQTNGNDLEAVKRILETVNATVTKQLLRANIHKYSDNSSDCQSITSAQSPLHNEFSCITCKKFFSSQAGLDEHECDQNEVKSEGLAAKLEDAITTKSEENHNGDSASAIDDCEYDKHNERCDDYEMDAESNDQLSEDGRKVRVRSLISEEQLKILKDNYSTNPRPKREELIKIAEKIGFPVRVVQVWFQNTRARDRREGRLIQIPFNAAPSLRFPSTLVPSTSPYLGHKSYPMSPSPPQYSLEQPLDLSFKKEIHSHDSSPDTSPRRPASVQQYDSSEDAVNLSQRSSRSPTPFQHIPYPPYQQNSNSSEPHRTPSPLDFNNGSRLAQILAQPAHKLGIQGIGLMPPMDRLMQFGTTDLPSLSHIISTRISNHSPNSDKRKWNDLCDTPHENQEDELNNANKRAKVSHLVMKGLNSPMLGNPDGEIEGQFSCDQCDKAFTKQSSLARHKYEHSGQRPHKCNECPKAFKHKHHLTEHKRLHSGEKPFQCSKCLKRFSHSGSYSQHMNHRFSYCKPYRE